MMAWVGLVCVRASTVVFACFFSSRFVSSYSRWAGAVTTRERPPRLVSVFPWSGDAVVAGLLAKGKGEVGALACCSKA